MEKKFVLESSLDGMSKMRVSFDNLSDAVLFVKFAELIQGPNYRQYECESILTAISSMIGEMTIIYVNSIGEESDLTLKYRNPDFQDASYDLTEHFGFTDCVRFVDSRTGYRFPFKDVQSAIMDMNL